jgi:hypothetical protein
MSTPEIKAEGYTSAVASTDIIQADWLFSKRGAFDPDVELHPVKSEWVGKAYGTFQGTITTRLFKPRIPEKTLAEKIVERLFTDRQGKPAQVVHALGQDIKYVPWIRNTALIAVEEIIAQHEEKPASPHST